MVFERVGVNPDYRESAYQQYVAASQRRVIQWNADRYREYYQGYYRQKYQPLLTALKKDAEFLEIGCGAGLFLNALIQDGFTHVAGIDISPEQVAIARKFDLPASTADVFKILEEDSKSYDCVIAIDVLEHFSKEEGFQLLKKIKTRLREGGMIVIQTVNGSGLLSGSLIYGDITHSAIYTPRALEQMLRLAGFSSLLFYESVAFAGKLALVRRFMWWFIRLGVNLIKRIESGRTQSIWSSNLICVAR